MATVAVTRAVAVAEVAVVAVAVAGAGTEPAGTEARVKAVRSSSRRCRRRLRRCLRNSSSGSQCHNHVVHVYKSAIVHVVMLSVSTTPRKLLPWPRLPQVLLQALVFGHEDGPMEAGRVKLEALGVENLECCVSGLSIRGVFL